MSSEQQQHQHPLDKRLQAVIDEYQEFSSSEPQDQIYKEILALRATLLRSYDENDYVINLQALEVETAQLYSEIDASQADAVQLERQEKINDLRAAIEEDKKTVQNFLDSSPDTRMAYLIGVASHVSLDDRDELMELISTIDSLYEHVTEEEKGIKISYVLDGEIHEATVEKIYQEFFSRTQPLRSPNDETHEQSDTVNELSDASINNAEDLQELGDEAHEYLNELRGITGNPLFDEQVARTLEQEAHIIAKPLPPLPPKKLREQMLKKLDERLDENYAKMRGIANNIDKATEEKVIARDMVFHFEAEKENNLYLKIKEYVSASIEDRVLLKAEIDGLLDGLKNHYSKNTETYTDVLEAAGKDAPINAQIDAEIAKLRRDIDPFLQVAPRVDASKSKSVVQSSHIEEKFNKPLPPTPEEKNSLMDKIKATPIPPAPKEEHSPIVKSSA